MVNGGGAAGQRPAPQPSPTPRHPGTFLLPVADQRGRLSRATANNGAGHKANTKVPYFPSPPATYNPIHWTDWTLGLTTLGKGPTR